MASTLLTSFSFTFLSFSLFLIQVSISSPPASPPPGSLVQKVCSQHTNPKFCFDQLNNDPQGKTSDLFGLGNVGIRLAKASSDTSHIKALLATEKDPKTKDLLTSCLDDYDNAGGSLDDAAVDIGQKDYSKLNLDASAASDYGSDCEDRFGEANVKSPITADNQALQDLAQIIEIVANMLRAGGTRP